MQKSVDSVALGIYSTAEGREKHKSTLWRLSQMSAKETLIGAGYVVKGTVACGKCRQLVTKLESPAGKTAYVNADDHFTEPGAVHDFSCGTEEKLEPLPPIPDQS